MITELEALLILTMTPYLGSKRIQSLIHCCRSATLVLEQTLIQLKNCEGYTSKLEESWGWWQKSSKWQEEFEMASRYQTRIISYQDEEYPKGLLSLDDFPPILYVKGKILPVDQEKSIAIVGTRECTLFGKEKAETIAEDLSQTGYTIVSGLAKGIDTAAHIGALKHGRTLAVLGSGLANIYPKENIHLSYEIAKNGAVISEFAMREPPHRYNFPKRNRLVSGMTLATFLVEAPVKSGAMITVHEALSQKKTVFALLKEDCHCSGNQELLNKKLALPIQNFEEIIQGL